MIKNIGMERTVYVNILYCTHVRVQYVYCIVLKINSFIFSFLHDVWLGLIDM
jgi:hypothetical protein